MFLTHLTPLIVQVLQICVLLCVSGAWFITFSLLCIDMHSIFFSSQHSKKLEMSLVTQCLQAAEVFRVDERQCRSTNQLPFVDDGIV